MASSHFKKIPTLLVLGSIAIGLTPIDLAAKERTFSFGKRTIALDLPEDWKTTEALFGVDHLLLGPPQRETRPTISVSLLKASHEWISSTDLDDENEQYLRAKKLWLKKRGGSLLESSYGTTPLLSGSSSIRFGSRYLMGSNGFTEESYLVSCGERSFHIKTLMHERIMKKFTPIAQRIVTSFQCKK